MPAAGVVGLFDSLTGGEVLFVMVLALVVMGPERLPEMARTLGQWMSTLRRMTADLQGEMREVMDDPALKSIREVGEFVAQPRKKLSELVIAAEADATAEAAKAEANGSEASGADGPAPADPAPTDAEPTDAEPTDAAPEAHGEPPADAGEGASP